MASNEERIPEGLDDLLGDIRSEKSIEPTVKKISAENFGIAKSVKNIKESQQSFEGAETSKRLTLVERKSLANERKITNKGDNKTQLVKLVEEIGELSKAILENNSTEIEDAIGDSVVVLTNLATLSNLRIEDCINSAYKEIKNREGKIINGTFVKNKI